MPHLTPPPEDVSPLEEGFCSYAGFVFGQPGVNMVATNLYDLPEIINHDVPRGNSHGSHLGPDTIQKAYWWVEIEIWPSRLRDVSLDDVIDAIEPDKESFFIWRPLDGREIRWRHARISRRTNTEISNLNHVSRKFRMMLEFHAIDPRWYFDAGEAVVRPFEAGGRGGIIFPVRFPISFTDRTGQGVNSVDITNNGNINSNPFINIIGPATNPELQIITDDPRTSRTMQFTGNLTSDQTLEVDFDQRTVTLDGQNRYFWINDPSTWWTVPPGRSEFRFHSVSTSSRCSISWASCRV